MGETVQAILVAPTSAAVVGLPTMADVMERARKAFEDAGIPFEVEEVREGEHRLISKDAFVLRRCQIPLASARGEIAPRIAENLGCASQTVRDAIHDFNRHEVDALVAGSSRPKQTHTAFSKEQTEALKELLHHSPREFARDSTLWTLEMAAQVSFEEGITQKRVSAETIRTTLARLGKGWQQAKQWIVSGDPECARKKGSR